MFYSRYLPMINWGLTPNLSAINEFQPLWDNYPNKGRDLEGYSTTSALFKGSVLLDTTRLGLEMNSPRALNPPHDL